MKTYQIELGKAVRPDMKIENESVTEAIILGEERLRQAMRSSNIRELEEILSDELVFTNHLGTVISKQSDIEMHTSGHLQISEITLSDQRILPLGEIAVVTTRAEIIGSYQDSPTNGNFRFTRVWQRSSNSSWQVIVGHSSVEA